MARSGKGKPGMSAGGAREARRFLSPRELAERWGCSATTAQRTAKRAGIGRYYLGEGRNGMVRYLLSEVEAYEAARRVGPGPSSWKGPQA